MFEKLGHVIFKRRKSAVILFIVGILVAGGFGSLAFSRLDSGEIVGRSDLVAYYLFFIWQRLIGHRLFAICVFGNLLYYTRFLHIRVIASDLSSPSPPTL